MKAGSEKTSENKAAIWTVIALVSAGTLLVSGVANVGEESSLMGKLFIFFLGAIIAIQVIPGLMLFGAMIKGLFNMFGKKQTVPLEGDKH